MTAAKPTELFVTRFPSPVGLLGIYSIAKGICYINFEDVHGEAPVSRWLDRYLPLRVVRDGAQNHHPFHTELGEYFSRKRKRFQSRMHLMGTDFQLQVWTALRSIGYGETVSYKAIASLIGNPQATRAVGSAVGRNPLSIVIPCHRVIGEDGKLVGYGGGINNKKFLLQLEGAIIV